MEKNDHSLEEQMKKLLIIGMLMLLITCAFAERKALVIANWNYANTVLKSPSADADSMQKALVDFGFNVKRFNNLNLASLGAVIDSFAVKVKSVDEVVVYYSGHGANLNSINYLAPANVNLSNAQTYAKTCYNLGTLASKVKAAKTSIIVVEASKMWAPTGSKSGVPKSFTTMKAASANQMIIFSAEPGKAVHSSSLSYSLFTSALISKINGTETGINQFMPVMIGEMDRSTNSLQKPWFSGQLKTDFFFLTSEIKSMWKRMDTMEIEGGGSLSW